MVKTRGNPELRCENSQGEEKKYIRYSVRLANKQTLTHKEGKAKKTRTNIHREGKYSKSRESQVKILHIHNRKEKTCKFVIKDGKV